MFIPPVISFLKDLNRFEDDKHICFSYTPIDRLKVHNASILGAGLIARYSKLKCEDKFDNFILKSFNYLSDYQRSDGSWYYAETDYQSWIDSFHTAFNLASLQEIHSHFRDNEKVDKTIKSGQSFYLNNFLELMVNLNIITILYIQLTFIHHQWLFSIFIKIC